MEQYTDKEFVEYIIKHIVNNPDDVQISRKTDEMGVLIEVKVNPTDMGLLIGRAGTTAKAIRILARIIGMRNNARVNLRIIEPEGSTHPSARHEAPAEDTIVRPPVAVINSSGTELDLDDVVKDLQS